MTEEQAPDQTADEFDRETVDRLIERWQVANGVSGIELLILSTGDAPAQTTGTAQFRERAATSILAIGDGLPESPFVKGEVDGTGTIDLGGRRLSLLPTPGVSVEYRRYGPTR